MNRADVPRTASDYFGSMVESYDSLIRRAVPRYDEMTDRLMAYMPVRATRILELGCGTGNLTLRLAAGFPGAAITAVDAAPQMTEITASRYQGHARAEPRACHPLSTVIARFEDLALPDASFDLIASCMSLHHVRDKGPLYRSLARWLAPGGALRFGDQFKGATPEVHRLNWEMWLAFCREPGHCTEDEIRSLVDHASAHDHYAPVAEHVRMLREAGFTGCDCVWRNGMYGVLTADLPALS